MSTIEETEARKSNLLVPVFIWKVKYSMSIEKNSKTVQHKN